MEGASEASSLEQANESAVRANERTDERVAQYYSLYSWLLSTIVKWHSYIFPIVFCSNSFQKYHFSKMQFVCDGRAGAGAGAGAVMSWAGALSPMKYSYLNFSTCKFKQLKNAKKVKCDRQTDRPTDGPTRWFIGRVARDKNLDVIVV